MSTPSTSNESAPWTKYEFGLKSQKQPARNQSSPAGRDHTESQPSQQSHADERVPSAQQLLALPEPGSEDYEELRQAANILLSMRDDTSAWNEGGRFPYQPPAQRFQERNFKTRAKNGASSAASSSSSGFPPMSSVAFPDHLGLIQAEERSASELRLSSYDSEATVSVHSETKSEQQGEEEEEEQGEEEEE